MSTVSDYSSYQSATERLKDSYEQALAQSRENNQDTIEQVKSEYEEELAASRSDLTSQLENEKKSAREEITKLKEELYDQSGKKAAKEAKERGEEERQFTHYRNTVNHEADKKVNGLQDYQDQRLKEVYDATDEKVAKAVALQRKSTDRQVNDLQEEISSYRHEGRDVASDRAKAKAQVIAEYEKAHLDEKNYIAENYERTFGRMKDHDAETADRFQRRTAEITLTANDRAKKMVAEEKGNFKHVERDNAIREKYLTTTHADEMKSEQFRNQQAMTHLEAKHAADKQNLATAKDQTFQNYLGDKNVQVNYELASRDAKLKELQTTDDPLKVSPMVVNRIHQDEQQRFGRDLNAEKEADFKNLQAEKTRDLQERVELNDTYKKKFMEVTKDKQKVSDVQSKQFMTAYQEMKDLGENKVQSIEDRSKKTTDQILQKSNLMITETHQRGQEALDEQRDQLHRDKMLAVDEVDQNRKNSDREWFMKTNDLRRNLEQKISDERDLHEKSMAELRLEYDKKLRDSNRTSSRVLDDRVRGYEHQIRQQELAFKERERFLTEHYEEELDKMKHTNAQLIQKKS